jgi:hypothetical protein
MQDDDDLTYATKQLGSHLFPTHAVCTSCCEVKPIKSFKTKSTNAQAKAWGYTKAIEIVSNKCNLCRPKKKKVLTLSLNEIRNKIATGDIKGGAIGQMLLQDRYADGIRRKKEGVLKRWQTIRDSAWTQLLTDSDKEYDRTRKLAMNKTGEEHPHLHSFLTSYHAILKTTRQFFITQRKLGTRTPTKNTPWHDYINTPDKDRLLKLWTACPHEDKLRITPPSFLNNRLTNETTKGETA